MKLVKFILILVLCIVASPSKASPAISGGAAASVLQERDKKAEADKAMSECLAKKASDHNVNCTEFAAKASKRFLKNVIQNALREVDNLPRTDITLPCKARDIADDICHQVAEKVFKEKAFHIISKSGELTGLQACNETGYADVICNEALQNYQENEKILGWGMMFFIAMIILVIIGANILSRRDSD
jgi:hypothetical protein